MVKRNVGKNWNQLYQKEFGSLLDFAKSHSEFFEVNGTEIKLKDARYHAVPTEQFDVELRRISAETDHSNSSGVTSESSSDPVTDADAALAAQLHEAELEASISGDTAAEHQEAQDADEDWLPAGKKKKKVSRKQKNKERAKAVAAGGSNATTAPTQTRTTRSSSTQAEMASPSGKQQDSSTAPPHSPHASQHSSGNSSAAASDEVEDKEEEHVEALAQSLLNAFHGPFFCFNDSEVKPIYITELRNSYEGRSSAYLLIYRQVEVDTWGAEYDMKPHARTLLSSAGVTMKPPNLWYEQVQARNSELRQKRLEYENSMHSVKLTVYFPVHLTCDWPCVSLVDPDDLVSMGFLQPSLAKGLVVECDISKGMKVLREDILSRALTALGDADITAVLGGDGDINISKLQPLNAPGPKNKTAPGEHVPLFYMSPGLSTSDIVGDTLAHNSYIVLWSSVHAPNGSGDFELMASPPKSLTVTYKSEPSGQMATKDIYIPSSTAMADLCRVASEAVGLSPNQVQIHTMQERKVLYQTKTSGGKWKEWFATPLWKPSALTKAFALQSQRYNQMEWEEVLVENIGSAKPSSTSLANKEVIRRNRLRSVRVELDLGGSTMTRLLKEYAQGGALFPSGPFTQSVENKKYSVPQKESDAASSADVEDLSSTTAKVSFLTSFVGI